MEEHKIDPTEVARFDINQRIAKLEKDISKHVQKLQDKNRKRKAEYVEPLQKPENHVKRPWLDSVEAPHGLVDGCSATGLLSGNMHGPLAGWWHGNGAVHENSIGYNLFGMPRYSSGNGTIGTSEPAGRSFSHPLLPRSSLETGEESLSICRFCPGTGVTLWQLRDRQWCFSYWESHIVLALYIYLEKFLKLSSEDDYRDRLIYRPVRYHLPQPAIDADGFRLIY